MAAIELARAAVVLDRVACAICLPRHAADHTSRGDGGTSSDDRE
jgi:hypothetical protein